MINKTSRSSLILYVISALIFSLFLPTACKKEKSVFAVADFSFSGNVSATLPVTVQFTNSSIGLSYTWDFGDGSSSVEENPRHTYTQNGIYRVKLLAKGTNNVDSLIVDVAIGRSYGLIGWWPFNGNANDASGNGNNGTVNGGITLTTDRFGLTNSAYLFNGVTNASTGIEVPLTINAGASFAISVWFKSIDSTKVAQTILVGWPYQSIGISLNHPHFYNQMGSCIGNGSWQICAPGMPTIWNYTNKQEWHHILMQYNALNDVTTYYLDGGEVKSISHIFTYPQMTSASFGGQFQMSPGEVFKGVIDDVGVWNRVLTEQEIQSLYSATQ